MTKRFDVCAPRAGKDDKTFWHRVGTAFEGEKGVSIIFDSLPLPDKQGKVSVFLFESKPKKDDGDIKPPGGNAPQKPRASLQEQADDEIPF